MRISDWSSDVCSSGVLGLSCVGDHLVDQAVFQGLQRGEPAVAVRVALDLLDRAAGVLGDELAQLLLEQQALLGLDLDVRGRTADAARSEERRVGKESVGTCRSRWSPNH